MAIRLKIFPVYYIKHGNSQCICVTAILKPHMHDKRKMAVVPSNSCYAAVWGEGLRL